MDVKKILLLIVLITSFHNVFSQTGLNIGIVYRPRHDATISNQFGSVDIEYSAKREDLGLIAGYNVWRGLNMATSLGVSFSNIETNLYALPSLNRSSHQSLSNVDLFLSQDIRYELLRIAKNSNVVNLNIGPIVNLTYYQNLSNRKQHKGFSDLNDKHATDYIDREKLPAANISFSSPFGYLSVSGGIYLNLVLFKKIGIDYSLGYYSNISGKTDIDVKYKFETNTILSDKFSTKENGLIQSFSVRYYFK